jgi:hypothetical protein
MVAMIIEQPVVDTDAGHVVGQRAGGALAARVVPAVMPDAAEPKPATVQAVPAQTLTTAADIFRELVGDDHPAGDERLLLELAAREGELIHRLHLTERKVAARLDQALDSPKTALAVARVLREVVRVDCSIARRTTEILGAANELRCRRLLLGRGGRGLGL